MPFTLAHPVLILPVARRFPRLPLSALVIGSMSPDFPYFLLLHSELYHAGHSFLGQFTFCLPMGLIALLAFHKLLKMPLLALLPRWQAERLYRTAQNFAVRDARDIGSIVLALLIGSFGHIALDSFTHGNGWVVLRMPALQYEIPPVHFPVYKVLQYGGSIAGLWVLYVSYRHWLTLEKPVSDAVEHLRPRPTRRSATMYGIFGLAASCLTGAAYTSYEYVRLHGDESPKKHFADGLEAGMASATLGLVVYGLYWLRRHKALKVRLNRLLESDD
jgi:hypothetical protein